VSYGTQNDVKLKPSNYKIANKTNTSANLQNKSHKKQRKIKEWHESNLKQK
jgi:hypothetical protein